MHPRAETHLLESWVSETTCLRQPQGQTSKEVSRFPTSKYIEWKYILELSPHWGGFYERLNRMIKSALRKILWKSKLTYEEVEPILT